MPVIQYYNGASLHSIWAVPSLGVNPVDGKEYYIDRDGNMTDSWSAKNLVNCGSSDPLFTGNFGFNGEIAGIGISCIFTFYGGGYIYNTTLLNKVENSYVSSNLDRRVYEGRWAKAGDVVPYRQKASTNDITMPTSRFVQRNNVLNVSSLSLYYEFPFSLVRKIKLDRLRATVYVNDLYKFSSIEVERGTAYPYARDISFSLTATF